MYASSPFIEETRFGNWFIRSDTWRASVLCRALDDLQRLMPAGVARYPRILDVGCGYGLSFAELARRFSPDMWWSRPDIGFFEWIGMPVPKQREETLINAVATKPNAAVPRG
jgi:SAM-dependent methyltransferase